MGSEYTYSEHELLTYRGRCIQDTKDLGTSYFGSCSLAVHVEQMRDPTSWVHSAVNRWLHAVKLHDAREKHGDYESLLDQYNALLAETSKPSDLVLPPEDVFVEFERLVRVGAIKIRNTSLGPSERHDVDIVMSHLLHRIEKDANGKYFYRDLARE